MAKLTKKEKLQKDIEKLQKKRDNSSSTFEKMRLFSKIKKMKDKLKYL